MLRLARGPLLSGEMIGDRPSLVFISDNIQAALQLTWSHLNLDILYLKYLTIYFGATKIPVP
jgi:hypothetical protein